MFTINKNSIDAFRFEINTVFSTIKALPWFIDYSVLSQRQQKFFNHAEKTIDYTFEMLQRLICGIEWESGLKSIRKDFITINYITDAACHLLVQEYPDIYEQTSFNSFVDIDKPAYLLDSANLPIAFYEIIKNGILFNISKNKCVQTTIFYENNNLIFDFKDNGIGIDRENWKNIFFLMQVFPKNKKSSKGAGIGLTIAKSIITAHGGNVFVLKSKIGENTVIRVVIPGF